MFFNDVPNSKTYKIGLDGKVSVFVADTQAAATARRSAPMAGCTPWPAAPSRSWPTTPKASATVIAEGFRGNDLVVRHDGGIYVTNPGWNGNDPSKVWYISPQGEKKVVDTGLKFSNGITLSPDQIAALCRRQPHALGLQLSDSARRLAGVQAEVLPPARARHGRRQRRRRHAGRPRRPAVRGHAAGHSGLRPGGPGELHHPDAERQSFECVFGGENFDTLFATCGDRVFKRKVKVKEAQFSPPPAK